MLASLDLVKGEEFSFADTSCVMPLYFVAMDQALGCFNYLFRDIALWTSRETKQSKLFVAVGRPCFYRPGSSRE